MKEQEDWEVLVGEKAEKYMQTYVFEIVIRELITLNANFENERENKLLQREMLPLKQMNQQKNSFNFNFLVS